MVLQTFFDEIFGQLEGKKKIKLDFRYIDILSSSTVPPILNLIQSLEETEISTEIMYNKNLEWQEAAFKALGNVTALFKNISVVGYYN